MKTKIPMLDKVKYIYCVCSCGNYEWIRKDALEAIGKSDIMCRKCLAGSMVPIYPGGKI